MLLPKSKDDYITSLEHAHLGKFLQEDSKWLISKKHFMDFNKDVNCLIEMKSSLTETDFRRIKGVRDKVRNIQVEAAHKSKKNDWFLYKDDLEKIIISLNELLDSCNSHNTELEKFQDALKENEKKQDEENEKKEEWLQECARQKSEINKYVNTIKSDLSYIENYINKNETILPQAFDSSDRNIQKLAARKEYILADSKKEISDLVKYISGLFEKAEQNNLDKTLLIRFENIISKLTELAETQNVYPGKKKQKKLKAENKKLKEQIATTTVTKEKEAEENIKEQENFKKLYLLGIIALPIIAFFLSKLLGIIVGIIVILVIIFELNN